MLIRRVSVLAIAIITLTSTIAIAQTQPGGWLRKLNLTPQQFQQIRQIRSQSQQQIAQKAQLVRQGQQELRDLLAGTSASQGQVRDKYNQLNLTRLEVA